MLGDAFSPYLIGALADSFKPYLNHARDPNPQERTTQILKKSYFQLIEKKFF